MASRSTSQPAALDARQEARLHFVLRFSAGTTAAFVVCEWMGWQPSALAAVLTAVLLANLPFSPPFKLGIGLIVIMGLSAWLTFLVTTFMSGVPYLLFGLIGLILFLVFYGL